MKRRLQTGMHLRGDSVAPEYLRLRGPVHAHVMRQVAARPQDHFGRLAQAGFGKFFRDYVIPGRARAGKNKRGPFEAPGGKKFFGEPAGLTEKLANRGFVVEHSFVQLHSAEPDLFSPAGQRLHYGLKLATIADARPAAFDPDLEQHLQRAPGRLKKLAKLFHLRGVVDQTEIFERLVSQQRGNNGHILLADQLVGHQDPAHAMLVGHARLMRGGQRDAPGARLQLPRKKRRGHRRFAVRSKLQLVSLDKPAHPVQVVFQFVFVQNRGRQADIFAQKIPSKAAYVAGFRRLREAAESFVQKTNLFAGHSTLGPYCVYPIPRKDDRKYHRVWPSRNSEIAPNPSPRRSAKSLHPMARVHEREFFLRRRKCLVVMCSSAMRRSSTAAAAIHSAPTWPFLATAFLPLGNLANTPRRR